MKTIDKISIPIGLVLFYLILTPIVRVKLYSNQPDGTSTCSMSHFTEFDEWWESREHVYSRFDITKDEFLSFPASDGYLNYIGIPLYVPPSLVKVGDVIGFLLNTTPVGHRVVQILEDDSGVTFITMGDNNDAEDEAISEDKYLGKVFFLYPFKSRKGFEGCALLENEGCKSACYAEMNLSSDECNSLFGREKDFCIFVARDKDCTLISNESLRDDCFYALGVWENVRYCNNIQVNLTREGCYRLSLHYLNQNVEHESDCHNISGDRLKDECYFIAAKKLNNSLICHKITDSSKKDECFYWVAYLYDHIDACDSILNVSMRTECEANT